MDPNSADDRLVDALGRIAFLTMGALSDLAGDAGLSLTQLRVLAILRDRRLRMSDLAAYLGLERSTMSGLVARAEKQGLMERVPNEGDARAVDVVLTPLGHEVAARIEVALRQALAPYTGRLDAGEKRTLSESIENLVR
ncbi:MarR family transcriptional regulator [Herbiconiux moechotypicola]|uniref:MarR family transcriptional regulator n=1 Tax=Herbiconiux moechotypicola TaxID=637393 RepID=A0ABN3DEQ4_9MICO|nr:MarR family transcriptional regulator [Herbiconiux moechotypicola]MCS5729320.1 MarR family transcriptional regulator [Herbiconiux moechotypicola]